MRHMPRPKKLSDGKIITLYLERAFYDAIRDRAKANGLSVSEYVRRVLMQTIPELSTSETSDPVPKDPEPDPIEELELRDLETALDELQNRMQIWLERQRQYMSTLRYGSYSGNQPLTWDMVKRWSREWHNLKRWYYSIRDRAKGEQALGTVQSKLITVHDMIEEARKLLRSKK
jgi:hypothetical protein